MDAAVMRWRAQLNLRVFPLLANWVRCATDAQQLGTACILYAHLAYLYRNTLETDLNQRSVATLLTAQIFLNVHYAFDAEPDPPPPTGPDGKDGRLRRGVKRSEFAERHNAELGIPQTELCELFACHRRGLIRWLEKASTSSRAGTLEAVVRTITFTRQIESVISKSCCIVCRMEGRQKNGNETVGYESQTTNLLVTSCV